MKPFPLALAFFALSLAACSPSDQKAAADVVHAATKAAAETGKELADRIAELARTAPEEARQKTQEALDFAAKEFREVRDSETVQKIAAEIEVLLDKLAELGQKLGPKLHLAELQQAVEGAIQRFENEPHVAKVLKTLQEKLQAISG